MTRLKHHQLSYIERVSGTAWRGKLGSRNGVVREQAPSRRSDRDLLEAVVRGDEDALVSLFDAHRGRVFGIAMRVLRDAYEAEDAVQETFVQIWTRPQAYDPERGEVAAWIRIIARSRALDRLRRLRPALTPPREAAPPNPRIDEALCMRQALAGLTPDQRRVIELSYYEGMTQAEIARRLAVPLGTVKGRVRAGLIRLRECLDGSFR